MRKHVLLLVALILVLASQNAMAFSPGFLMGFLQQAVSPYPYEMEENNGAMRWSTSDTVDIFENCKISSGDTIWNGRICVLGKKGYYPQVCVDMRVWGGDLKDMADRLPLSGELKEGQKIALCFVNGEKIYSEKGLLANATAVAVLRLFGAHLFADFNLKKITCQKAFMSTYDRAAYAIHLLSTVDICKIQINNVTIEIDGTGRRTRIRKTFESMFRDLQEKTGGSYTIQGGLGAHDVSSHACVDLGLSVKWATCNVGASSPEQFGNYYAWGETSAKSVFTKGNYRFYDPAAAEYTYIPEEISGTKYDAARANWGGSWRLPTYSECRELEEKCTWVQCTLNGVKGCRVTGPNGNSIFLPWAGFYEGYSLDTNIFQYMESWGDNDIDVYHCLGGVVLSQKLSIMLNSARKFEDGVPVRPVTD